MATRRDICVWLLALVLCAACGGGDDDTKPATDSAVADTSGPEDAAEDAVEADTPTHDDAGGEPTLVECGSLLAARVMEMQVALDATFPRDCDAPLVSDIGAINNGGDPLCMAGESANACRDRVYDAPPALGMLNPGCWNPAAPEAGCLRGKWLPKCTDGSDDGCASPEVVCQDGTRPMIYLEAGGGAGSNDWVFFMGGEGGPCTGTRCWLNYKWGAETNKDEFEKAMSSTHPEYRTSAARAGSGLTNGVAGLLASYNRAKWNRCSDTASDGMETVSLFDLDLAEDDPTPSVWGSAPVWQKGLATWLGLFRSLATAAGRDLDGDGVPDLPPFSDAETVLIAGSSDASLWVIFAADRLRAELQAIAGPGVNVRILLDGYFDPMLDNEGRYGVAAPADFSLFTHPYATIGSCALPDDGNPETSEACSDLTYESPTYPDGAPTTRGAMAGRSTRLDESCEAHHGVGAGACYDKLHTLVHHLETPAFVLADQEDNTVSGVPVAWVEERGYGWPSFDVYRQRVLDQAYDIRDHYTTAAREEGAGEMSDLVFMLRKSRRDGKGWGAANHVHFGDNTKMQWKMTRCTAAGDEVLSVSSIAAIAAWATTDAPTQVIAEDAATWDGASDFWVSGAACPPPE